ncbi:glycosyltransferase family 4 protein [Rhodospirillum sp. A1_3_36]|uniref:glycosyltransferase family 4 protein n=1 Tax=Rhodospirillum sp. A1_3_36 TaxID=3391666 RepID=UPI0039A65D73
MRVVVSTIGRFHSFDLARQLLKHGVLEAIFTGYPRFKLKECQIPAGRLKTFPWIRAPYMALVERAWFQQTLERPMARYAARTLDAYVARVLPDCDVVSILSGAGGRSGLVAQARGARYVCDRGSSHIRFQDRILREEFDRVGLVWRGVDPDAIVRELSEYAIADGITVPSTFVRNSFLAEGVSADRLIQVPYGVDLSQFYRRVPRDREFRVLFVGGLSVRKGLHDLQEAFHRADLPGARLVLTGGAMLETATLLARRPLTALERTGHLSLEGVAREMSRASVMVLPSLEEGMATVMAQAMACGCPVIATENTGAADLFTDGVEGFITPIRDPDAIADRLTRLHADPELLDRMSKAAEERTRTLGGWDDYGRRIVAAFEALCG